MAILLWITPLVLTAIAWFVFQDLIFMGLLGVAFMVYFYLYLRTSLLRFNKKESIYEQYYQFINNFIITLSVKQTLDGALNSMMGQLDEPLKEEINMIQSIDTLHILSSLKQRFNYPTYDMFMTILDLHQKEGGSILKMSQLFLAQERSRFNSSKTKLAIAKRKLTSYVILWVLTLIILLFARFGIASLYTKMLLNPIFKICLFAYFILLLWSIHNWWRRFLKIYV